MLIVAAKRLRLANSVSAELFDHLRDGVKLLFGAEETIAFQPEVDGDLADPPLPEVREKGVLQ